MSGTSPRRSAASKPSRASCARPPAALGGGGGTAAGVPFAHAALPFLPFAWLATASVLGCNGGPCAQLARFYLEGADGRTAPRLVVVANACSWVLFFLPAFSLYPFLFRVLGAPSSATGARAALRFLCDCLVVWLAYAALGVVAWAGSAFCYLGIAHIGRDSPAGYWGYWFLGFLVWTSVLCEWNYRLFAEKADRRRGAPRRSVSEVRTPRPFPMPSPSTDDEPGLIR